jgi:hypothetical protein
MPPARTLHTPANGYVLAMTLSVKDCSSPVKGSATVVLPREFFREERSGGLRLPVRPLFGLAFSDPRVHVTSAVPSSTSSGAVSPYRSWSWGFDDPLHAHATGRDAVVRIDGWNKSRNGLNVNFTAPWLHPRGYHTCWLSVPELVSADLRIFGVNASDSVEQRLGARAGATPLLQGEFSSKFHIHFVDPNGKTSDVAGSEKQTNQYADASTPPGLGSVYVSTRMTVLTSDSHGAAPTVGPPIWTCRGDQKTGTGFLGQSTNGAFYSSPDGGMDDYLPATPAQGCGAWVALAQAGAQTGRDIWLLVIGATISAGVALLVDAVVRRRRRDASDA